MATLQQILEEQNLEAKIDKRIEKCVNLFLKKNKKSKQVYTRKEADAIIIYNRDNLLKYTLILNEQLNSFITKLEGLNRTTLIYLKNKNHKDGRHQTMGSIKNTIPRSSKHN